MQIFRKNFSAVFLSIFSLFIIGYFVPYSRLFFNKYSPELILVLGGDVDREEVGLSFAKELDLPLVLTGGSNPEYANWLVEKSGISSERVQLDYRAADTFENFTSLIDDFSLMGIKHILLVTSEDHISRAMAVGQVILGSRGILLTGIPVSCNSTCPPEKFQKRIVDLFRSFIWVLTKKDLKILLESKWPEVFAKDLVK